MRDLDVSYLRVSTIRQRDEETIETQRFVLDHYFEQHAIHVPVELRFEDDGVSGGIEIHKRPSGSKLYSLINSERVRRLFLFHSDRVGRDTIDTLLFHRLAENQGTQIIGVADGTDTFREGNTLTTEIRAVIAAEYRRDCARRTTAGLRRRAAAGKISTHPPFGYDLEDGFLVLNKAEAEVMRGNFEEAARGRRTRDIVVHLNKSGAPSPRGRGWRHDTFIYLLKNRVYMGEFIGFRTPKKRPGGGRRVRRDPKEQITIPCPAIVSRELFETVQARLSYNRIWCSTSQKHFYMLKSLIRCGKCGRAYIGHTISGRKYKGKRYPNFRYYECGTLTNRDYEFCGNRSINASRLEDKIWSEIESFIYSPSMVISQLTARYNRQTAAPDRQLTKRIKGIEEKKSKNREAHERLALAFARGLILDDEVGPARDALARELAELEAEAQALTQAAKGSKAHKRQLLDAQAVLAALRDQVEKGFSEHKKAEITRCLVRQAVVNRGNDGQRAVTVHYAFPSVFSSVPDELGLSASSRKK